MKARSESITIANGRCWLYQCQEDYNKITVSINSKGKILTHWFSVVRSRNIFNTLKSNGCAICGYNKYVGALDFHHVEPKSKKYYISPQRLYRKDFFEELNKCILLCKNCHAELHKEDCE